MKCIFIFLAAALFYVVSIGPAYWLAARGYFGVGPVTWPADVYGPVFRAVDETALEEWLYWYIDLYMN